MTHRRLDGSATSQMSHHDSPPPPACMPGGPNTNRPPPVLWNSRCPTSPPLPLPPHREYITFETTGWHLRLNQGLCFTMAIATIIKVVVMEMLARGFLISPLLTLWLDMAWLGATSVLFLANIFRGPNYWRRYFWAILTLGFAYLLGSQEPSCTGWQAVIGFGIVVGILGTSVPEGPILPAPVQVPGPNLPTPRTDQTRQYANPGDFELQNMTPQRRN